MKDTIAANIMELRGRIATACDKYDRDTDDITVVAVTKRHPAVVVATAVASGIVEIGESRVQEAHAKIAELGRIARFHMVGHLQTNKVKKAVEVFDVIQSVDSLRLAEAINRHAGEASLSVECLVEVNCSGESQKAGVAPAECMDLIRQVSAMEHINLTGLMTIGPHTDDEAVIGAAFAHCRQLFVEGRELLGRDFDTLSMGMSSDLELAISHGSTMIRVGTALFGERPPLS